MSQVDSNQHKALALVLVKSGLCFVVYTGSNRLQPGRQIQMQIVMQTPGLCVSLLVHARREQQMHRSSCWHKLQIVLHTLLMQTETQRHRVQAAHLVDAQVERRRLTASIRVFAGVAVHIHLKLTHSCKSKVPGLAVLSKRDCIGPVAVCLKQ